MRVLIIQPPQKSLLKIFPIGLAYIASVLRRNDVDVECLDCSALSIELDKIGEEIERRKPDLVGISASTPSYKQALNIAKITKEVDRDIIVVIGGTHVSILDKECLMESSCVDYVIRGEGEVTFLNLIKALDGKMSLKDVRGLTYRSRDNKLRRNPDADLIQNIDLLPHPAWDLFPMHLYSAVEIISGRGCPYSCKFCLTPLIYGKRVRARDPKRIVDELEIVAEKFPGKFISFWEANFTYDKRKASAICKEIIDRKLDVKWSAVTRVDLVSRDILLLMKKAGCEAIYYGVESGSQEILNRIGKGIRIDQIERAIKLTKMCNIKAIASFIIGYLGETWDSVRDTFALVKKLNPDHTIFGLAVPYPGTEFYREAEKLGVIIEKDWSRYTRDHPVISTAEFSAEDQLKALNEAQLLFNKK